MSQYTIEIDDTAVYEQINRILDRIISNEISYRYSETGREVSLAVKDLVYSKKEEIIERVVERAAREIVKKGMPKLLDKFS